METLSEEEEKIYIHGYSDEEVARILTEKSNISKRDKSEFPVTRDEVRTVIVPWNRIHRVKEFILHPVKTKAKAKAKPVTSSLSRKAPPKVKRVTKKFIAEEIGRIVFKIALEQEVTEEEQKFYDLHTKKEELL